MLTQPYREFKIRLRIVAVASDLLPVIKYLSESDLLAYIVVYTLVCSQFLLYLTFCRIILLVGSQIDIMSGAPRSAFQTTLMFMDIGVFRFRPRRSCALYRRRSERDGRYAHPGYCTLRMHNWLLGKINSGCAQGGGGRIEFKIG